MSDGSSSSEEDLSTVEHRDATGPAKRHRVSLSTCRRIAYVTQFMVVTCSLGIFMVVVYMCSQKYYNRNVLESKKVESSDEPWFKFAICLRPFMTPSMMDLFYHHHKRFENLRNYTAYLETLEDSDWKPSSWLDDHLRPADFKHYFTKVHPWKHLNARALWDFRYVYFQKAFQEIKINKKKMKTHKLPGVTDGTDTDGEYTILKRIGTPDSSKQMLYGDYSYSPYYGGCLNMTVMENMNRRQMEINIKFRDHISREISQLSNDDAESSTANKPLVSLFEAADVFVYDKNQDFSEFSVVHKFTKYSILAHSLERLLVKGSRYHRFDTATDCVNATGYSQTNCRHWCLMRALFRTVPCMLPWMRNHVQKPWIDAKFKRIEQCKNQKEFIEALNIQHAFLHPKGTNKSNPGKDCLSKTKCPDECNSYKVQLLSLGSKSIGSNYGISLTITPDVATVSTHFDYQLLTMVAELSASISFLLGLSAIAIYDWIIAFIVWLLVQMKIYKRPVKEEPFEGDVGDGGYDAKRDSR